MLPIEGPSGGKHTAYPAFWFSVDAVPLATTLQLPLFDFSLSPTMQFADGARWLRRSICFLRIVMIFVAIAYSAAAGGKMSRLSHQPQVH